MQEVTGALKSKNIIIQKSTLLKGLKSIGMLVVDISKLVFCYWWIFFGIKHSMESYYFIAILSIYIIKFIINMFLFIKKIKQGGGFLTMIMGGGMSSLMSKEAQAIKNPLKSGDLYFTISKIFIVLIILYLHFQPFN